jgi:TolA-binding protein
MFARLSAASRPLAFIAILFAMFLALLLLQGCDKDNDGRIDASAQYVGDAARPVEIVQAYTELQSGRPAQAYAMAQGFMDSHPGSPYRSEANYVAGRALADQGQFEQGKERLESVIDKTNDRSLKALAMLGRADCNMGMEKYALASRQYHWIEFKYKDVKALRHDEVMFKLGLAAKKANNQDWADYWFNQVNELYNTSPYAERARQESSRFTPAAFKPEKPLVFFLQANVFDKSERAEEAAAALRSKGYRDVEVVPSTRSSMPVYELHVGKFMSRAEAGRAQVDAQLAGLSTSVRPGTVEPMK